MQCAIRMPTPASATRRGAWCVGGISPLPSAGVAERRQPHIAEKPMRLLSATEYAALELCR